MVEEHLFKELTASPNENSKGRRARKLAVVGLVTVLGLLLFRAVYGIPFDHQGWIANPEGCSGINTRRAEMVNDLRFRVLRLGMSRERVRSLLGEPDACSAMDELQNRDVYCYGHAGWFGIDPSVLSLQYDKDGKLKRIDAGER